MFWGGLMADYVKMWENLGMDLESHDLLDGADVMNRIAPAPAAVRGKLCCGMSLLVGADIIEQANAVILREKAVYHSIVCMENPLQPKRDRYC